MSKIKLMLGNAVEISLIFRRILGPLVLGWAPNHFVLGAQLAPGEKKLSLMTVTIATATLLLLNGGICLGQFWVKAIRHPIFRWYMNS